MAHDIISAILTAVEADHNNAKSPPRADVEYATQTRLTLLTCRKDERSQHEWYMPYKLHLTYTPDGRMQYYQKNAKQVWSVSKSSFETTVLDAFVAGACAFSTSCWGTCTSCLVHVAIGKPNARGTIKWHTLLTDKWRCQPAGTPSSPVDDTTAVADMCRRLISLVRDVQFV